MHFTIREIDHVVIRCADLDNMVRFYGAALGCPVEKEQRDLGLVQLRAGRSLIDLLAVGGKIDRPDSGAPGAGRNMDHLCLAIDRFELDALKVWLTSRGVEIGDYGSRYGARGQGPSLYMRDPEGNVVELKGPPDAT